MVPPLSPPNEKPADPIAEVGGLRWRVGRLRMPVSAPTNLVSGQDIAGGIDTQIAQRGVVSVAFVADERASYAVSGTVERGFPHGKSRPDVRAGRDRCSGENRSRSDPRLRNNASRHKLSAPQIRNRILMNSSLLNKVTDLGQCALFLLRRHRQGNVFPSVRAASLEKGII